MRSKLVGISLLTITCLYGLLSAVVILIFILTGIPVIYGVVGGLIVLILQFLLAPFFTDLSMKWFYKANFKGAMPDYVTQFVNEICKKYNMKTPKIGYINDGAPNAFTYGRTKNSARVVLTRGIFELLKEDEVKAVIAHELGHAVHYDMMFMTFVQVVPLVLYAIYEAFTSRNSKSDKDGDRLRAIGYIAYILYIICQYIILFLSRTREYYADSFAIEETRSPYSLANALVKIGFGLSTKSSDSKHSASNVGALGIFNASTSKAMVINAASGTGDFQTKLKNSMKWEKWNLWAKFYELHSTHPLISKRLLAISDRCKEYNQPPYVVFDLVKPEGYIDDFLVEILICILPTIVTFISIFIAIFTDNLSIGALGLVVAIIFSFVKLGARYKNKNYKDTTVSDLLGEVKVSEVTAIPCKLTGTIIGRGNPGCIFNEDFVIKDSTGIMFLDYKQPVTLINKLFAIFRSKEYFDKQVTIEGWYRRSLVPYIEIKKMIVDGKVKNCYTYAFAFGSRVVLLLIALIVSFAGFMG